MVQAERLIFAPELLSTSLYKVTEAFLYINFTFLFIHSRKYGMTGDTPSNLAIENSFCKFVPHTWWKVSATYSPSPMFGSREKVSVILAANNGYPPNLSCSPTPYIASHIFARPSYLCVVNSFVECCGSQKSRFKKEGGSEKSLFC